MDQGPTGQVIHLCLFRYFKRIIDLDPGCEGLSRLLSDFELHRTMRLALHEHGARQNAFTLSDSANLQTAQVAACRHCRSM